MSILFGRNGERSEARSSRDEERSTYTMAQLARQFAQLVNGGGPTIGSVDEALRDAANWACVKIKAQGIAMLPVDEVRYQGKRRIEVPKSTVVRKPAASSTRRQWVFQVGASMFTDGNAFGLITKFNDAMRPEQIDLLNPEQVQNREVHNGRPRARIDGGDFHELFPYGDLWHIPGEMLLAGSPFALSPIWYGSRSTGTSLAAEKFGGGFFTESGLPSGILSIEGSQPNDTQSTTLKERFLSVTRGSREPVVLPSSVKWTPLTVNPNDSQFIELMRFEVEQACRRHGVPPSMIYAAVSGQNITYANVTQADLAYLKHTLSYPIDLIEDAWSDLLPETNFVKFNRDAILAGDPTARTQLQAARLKNRMTTVNEVRALEDMDPFTDPIFDQPGVPPWQQPTLFPEGGAA